MNETRTRKNHQVGGVSLTAGEGYLAGTWAGTGLAPFLSKNQIPRCARDDNIFGAYAELIGRRAEYRWRLTIRSLGRIGGAAFQNVQGQAGGFLLGFFFAAALGG